MTPPARQYYYRHSRESGGLIKTRIRKTPLAGELIAGIPDLRFATSGMTAGVWITEAMDKG